MPAPHDAVYTRLGASPIHGVGVFAILPIPAGVNPFAHDDAAVAWVEIGALRAANLSPELLRLYYDFGVTQSDRIGVPASFNAITPGWYVNQPAPGAEANLALTADFQFFATRDIARGEELTAVYAEYSETAAALKP